MEAPYQLCFLCRFEYLFNFDNTFEIHDDIEVLKRMGMSFGLESGKCSLEDLKRAKSLVPKALEGYITGMLTDAFTCCLWLSMSNPNMLKPFFSHRKLVQVHCMLSLDFEPFLLGHFEELPYYFPKQLYQPWRSLFSTPFYTLLSLFYYSRPNRYGISLWICISPVTNDANIFSRAYWPFVNLPWRMSIQILCVFF